MVETFGRHRRDPLRQLEGGGMRELEGWRKIEFGGGALDGVDDGLAAVACVHAPKASASIEKLSAGLIKVVHPLRTGQHAGLGFELAVRREGEPERAKIVWT